MDRFIVAEISKSWENQTPVEKLLCQEFERVINANHDRGYKLVEWKITSVYYLDVLTETIIAIFELQ